MKWQAETKMETQKKLEEDCKNELLFNPLSTRDVPPAKFFGYAENYKEGDPILILRNDKNPNIKVSIPVNNIGWWATNNPNEKPKKDEKTFDLISKKWVEDNNLTDIRELSKIKASRSKNEEIM